MKRQDLVGQRKFSILNPFIGMIPFDNIIYESGSPQDKWIEISTQKIGYWRAIFRSAYIKWAITINGLHLGIEKYEKINHENIVFYVSSLRPIGDNHNQAIIAEWNASKTVKAYSDNIPLICIYGIIDLYNCLEEFIFDFYRIYLFENPQKLIKGEENRKLKKLYKLSVQNKTDFKKWEKAFNARLNDWQKRRLYDSLAKVFISFITDTGIKKPDGYKYTTPETWAESINGVALLRNSLVHGAKLVEKDLAEFCKKNHSLNFDFKEGEELNVNLNHLQAVDLFLDQLLTALNISLMERGMEIRKILQSNSANPI